MTQDVMTEIGNGRPLILLSDALATRLRKDGRGNARVDPDTDLGFKRIRASVQPSPYNDYARTKYRADAATA